MTKIMRLLTTAGVVLLGLTIGVGQVGAQTLDRILKEKKIRITAEVTSPPFGMLDKENRPTGSEIETARQLAKDLGVELELVQVTGPQRIPALLSDRADLAISSLSITTERAKTVWFASPHGAPASSLAERRTSISRVRPTWPARRSA
jgi:polar amino acid transport system substrate-binding protein